MFARTTHRPRSILGFAPWIGVAIAACGETTHVFSGRLYVDDRDCVAVSFPGFFGMLKAILRHA